MGKNTQSRTRRQLLSTVAAGSAMALAGCGGGPTSDSGTDGLVFKKLPEEYVLSGGRKLIMNRSRVEDKDIVPGQQLRAGNRASTSDSETTATETTSAPKPQNPSVFTHRKEPPIDAGYYEIYLSEENLNRIDAEDGDAASISAFAPNPDLTTRAGARQNNEYIEQKADGGRDTYLITLAPHGGQVEGFTAQQAKRVSNRLGVASWWTLGFDGNGPETAKDRWFVPTTEISKVSYPKLSTFRSDFAFALSFDGFDSKPRRTDGEAVAVGGLVSESKRRRVANKIQQRLDDAGASDVSVYAYKTGAGRGATSDHLVNRMTSGGRTGIEIAQTLDVRRKHWAKVSDGAEAAVREILNEFDSDWNSN